MAPPSPTTVVAAPGAPLRTLLDGLSGDELDATALLARIAQGACRLVPGAEGSAVELLDSGGHLVYVATAGFLTDTGGAVTITDSSRSLSGHCLAEGRLLVSPDTVTDWRVDRRTCRRFGIGSMACVPLRRGRTPIGVLKVAARAAGRIGPEGCAVLDDAASFLSVVISAAAHSSESTAALLAARPGDVVALDFVADVLRPGVAETTARRRRIEAVLDGRSLRVVLQPIVDLVGDRLAGYEALARFDAEPSAPPDVWFAEAEKAGLGLELELAAVARAVELLPALAPDVALGINVGPRAFCSDQLVGALGGADPARLLVELTEHAFVADMAPLVAARRRLRAAGVKVALDDGGAGYSGLSRILELAPDVIKLDRVLIAGIDTDPVRRSLAAALVAFATETGATIVAEGVETAGELDAVRALRVPYAQGFHLGPPVPAGAGAAS